MKDTLPHRARLGDFEVDFRSGEVWAGDRAVRIQEKSLRVLQILVEHAGELVTREEIQRKLWPNDTIVDFEHGINNAIKLLRRTLCDSPIEAKYIETIPRRGYRLIVPVKWVGPEDSSNAAVINEVGTHVPPQAGLIGKKVSHYRVLEVLGGGGMGMVYKAEDLRLGRPVALKFLPPELAGDPLALQRFEREARAASSLDHPNICTIYEVEEYDGQPFIVMQLLQGETLREQLGTLATAQKKMTLDELLDIAFQICNGLEEAHAKGIIHRDIKPANIFLCRSGQVKILDFGIAKLVEAPDEIIRIQQSLSSPSNGPSSLEGGLQLAQSADATLTRVGVAMGTAGYMSPEQVRGEKLDARTDIFSFGLVLYEMATGQRAFTGETAALVHDAILNSDPTPARQLNSDISPALDTVIRKTLEKDCDRRYQTAARMRGDLEQIKPKSPLLLRTKWRWSAAAALLIVALAAASLVWRPHRSFRLDPKDTIVIAHFTNLTGDVVMEDALDWPLNRELQESPYVTALWASKVADTLQLLKVRNVPYIYVPQTPKLTPGLARDVCVRSDSRVFVTASIANVGNYYHIVINAQDCHSGTMVAKVEAETNERNQIIRTLGIAGHQLRRQLGEPEASLKRFNTPLENETSSSLEALHTFSQAMRVSAEKGYVDAIPEFKRLVELDPTMAFAYMNLAALHQGYGETRLAIPYMTMAFNLRERLSQRSRWFMEAKYYDITGDLDKAAATYLKWVQTFPADVSAHANLSVTSKLQGQPERAVVEAREVVRLSPNVESYGFLMGVLLSLNRLEETRAVYDEARSRGFDGWPLHGYGYVLALVENDSAAMQEHVSWVQQHSPTPEAKEWAMQVPADLAIYHGRFRAAQELYSAMGADPPNVGEMIGHWHIVKHTTFADVETGFPVRSRLAAEKALAAAPPDGLRRALALTLARASATNNAEELTEVLNRELPSDTLVQRYELPIIRAAIEIDNNRPGQAIEALRPTLSYDLAIPVDLFPPMYPAYLRGLAYLKLRKGPEAAVEFQRMIDHSGILQDFITAPLSHLQLARAQAMMGDKTAARKSYQDFLTLWNDADPDIPIYKQAKAEYAKLQ